MTKHESNTLILVIAGILGSALVTYGLAVSSPLLPYFTAFFPLLILRPPLIDFILRGLKFPAGFIKFFNGVVIYSARLFLYFCVFSMFLGVNISKKAFIAFYKNLTPLFVLTCIAALFCVFLDYYFDRNSVFNTKGEK